MTSRDRPPPDAVRHVRPRTPGLRGMPAARHTVGPPAAVPDVRPRRLLRLVADAACPRARPRVGHPIVQSMEPGENWRWCYVHEALV